MMEFELPKTKLPSVSKWINPNYKSQGYVYKSKLVSELNIPSGDIPTNWKIDHPNFYWRIEKFTDIRESLNQTLVVLDEINNVKELQHLYRQVSDLLLPYHLLKGATGILSVEYGAEVVTNAWLKMYELCVYLDQLITKKNVIESGKNKGKKKSNNLQKATEIKSFHVAEAPGNFILAINHWLRTHKEQVFWNWKASSYIELYDTKSNYLTDSYGLIKNYPDNWVFGADGDGDITSSNNIRSFGIKNELSFTTGDVKYIPSNMDYSREENINIPVVIGQFLSSIWGLASGGILINKMFTFNEPATICMMMLGSYVFEKFIITKPLTSRPANTEIYIVGIGYKKNLTKLESTRLLTYMEYIRTLNTGDDVPPLFILEDIDQSFLENLYTISSTLRDSQIEHFNKNIELYNVAQEEGIETISSRLRDSNELIAREWIDNVGIKELPETYYMRSQKKYKK